MTSTDANTPHLRQIYDEMAVTLELVEAAKRCADDEFDAILAEVRRRNDALGAQVDAIVAGFACVVCGGSALDLDAPPMVPAGAGNLFRHPGCEIGASA